MEPNRLIISSLLAGTPERMGGWLQRVGLWQSFRGKWGEKRRSEERKRKREREGESTEGTSNDVEVSCKNKQLDPLSAHPLFIATASWGTPPVYFPSADSS